MIEKREIFGLLLLLTCLCVSGCQLVYLGPDNEGCYIELEKNPVSTKKALALAEPYLHEHYQLQLSNQIWVPPNPDPVDYVFLKGNWYYIDRDNYPYKFVDQYYWNSIVKVHKITGKVVELR